MLIFKYSTDISIQIYTVRVHTMHKSVVKLGKLIVPMAESSISPDISENNYANTKMCSERRKHCELAEARWNQNLPRHRPPSQGGGSGFI